MCDVIKHSWTYEKLHCKGVEYHIGSLVREILRYTQTAAAPKHLGEETLN